jgi:hypothetical protein
MRFRIVMSVRSDVVLVEASDAMVVSAGRLGKHSAQKHVPPVGKNATHNFWRTPVRVHAARRQGTMTLGERLKLIRGTTSQRAFAAELRVHENTVSNAERRDSATQDYLLKLAAVRGINLHWLLTGHGAMRVDAADGSLLQETLSLALADAMRAAYGSRYGGVPLEMRARALRAGVAYLRAIGVTTDTLPDTDALAKLLRLTVDVMRQAG